MTKWGIECYQSESQARAAQAIGDGGAAGGDSIDEEEEEKLRL